MHHRITPRERKKHWIENNKSCKATKNTDTMEYVRKQKGGKCGNCSVLGMNPLLDKLWP